MSMIQFFSYFNYVGDESAVVVDLSMEDRDKMRNFCGIRMDLVSGNVCGKKKD